MQLNRIFVASVARSLYALGFNGTLLLAFLKMHNYYYCRGVDTHTYARILLHLYIGYFLLVREMRSEQEDRRRLSARTLQIDSGAETGLVNSSRRF